MKNVIIITGASSGFGALAARALAIRAPHIPDGYAKESAGSRCRPLPAPAPN